LGVEFKKLYNLIWKRTVASQMAYAKINIQTIYIDILKNNISVLPDKTNFVSIFEKILFDGFLVLYNNHESDNKKGKVDIKKEVDVEFKNMIISEEYTKPPLRFNEAGLTKHLENNGIGRPSTYASIITKIVEKKYVTIENIEGVKKGSNIININKSYKISTKSKDISIGNETKKLCPTEIGIKVNDFLTTHFNNIMETDFTVNLEKQLDKVACGKAKWYNILDMYYKTFNPMVLELQEKNKHIGEVNNTDELFGHHPDDNREIYKGDGKYGPYIKIMDDEKTWKFASLKDVDDLTMEKAVKLFEYPKYIGKINNSKVTLNKGQYGLYFKIGTKKHSIKDETRELNLEYATQLNNTDDPFAIKTFKFDNKTIYLKKGPYGYFLKVKFTKSNKTKNISLPDNFDVEKFNIDKFITK
jgi:DNA topoisomerase-1